MIVAEKCDMEDHEKYVEINKVLEEVEIPYPNWSKEDNKIKSIFLHSKETVEVKDMDIP